MIANPLDVLGHEEQMGAGADAAWIFHHVSQQLAEEARMHLVELRVPDPYRICLVGTPFDVGIEDILDQELREMGHARQSVDRSHRGCLAERDRTLCNI